MIEVAGTPASESSPEALRAVATPTPRIPAAAHASLRGGERGRLAGPGQGRDRDDPLAAGGEPAHHLDLLVAQVAVAVEDGGERGAVDHGGSGVLALRARSP